MAVKTNAFTGLSQSVRDEEVTPKPYVQPTSDTAQSSLDNVTEPSTPKKKKKRRSRSSSTFVQPTSDTAQSSLDNVTGPSTPKKQSNNDLTPTLTQPQQREEAFAQYQKTNLQTSNDAGASSRSFQPEQKQSLFSVQRTYEGEVLSPLQKIQERTSRALAKETAKKDKTFWGQTKVTGLQVAETVFEEAVGVSSFFQDRFKTSEEKKALKEQRESTSTKEKFTLGVSSLGLLGGELRVETEPKPIAQQLTQAGMFFVGPELIAEKFVVKAESKGSKQLFRLLNEEQVDSTLKFIRPQKVSVADQPATFNVDTGVIELGPTREFFEGGNIRLRDSKEPTRFTGEFQSQLIQKDVSKVEIDPFTGVPTLKVSKSKFDTSGLIRERQVGFKDVDARPFPEAQETTLSFLNNDKIPKISVINGEPRTFGPVQTKISVSSPEGEFKGLFGEQKQLTSNTINLDAQPTFKFSPQKKDMFEEVVRVDDIPKKNKFGALFRSTKAQSTSTLGIDIDSDVAFKRLKESGIGRTIKSAEEKTIANLNQAVTPSKTLKVRTDTLGFGLSIDKQPSSKLFINQQALKKISPSIVDSRNKEIVSTVQDNDLGKQNLLSQEKTVKIVPIIETTPKSRTKSASRVEQIITPDVEQVIFQENKPLKQTNDLFNPVERVIGSTNRPPRGFGPIIPSFKKVYAPLNNNLFVAEVKTRGNFLKYSDALSYEGAFSKGEFGVKNTASASFRIRNVRTGEVIKPSKSLSKGFRLSKVDDSVIVQRRGFRIGSAGEKREITYKGIFSSKKNKKSKRFSLWE